MAISADDLPSANLPAESSQYGEPTQLQRERKAFESAGVGRRTAPQGAPPPNPSPGAAGGAPAQSSPVQPAPQSGMPTVAQQPTRAPEQAITMSNLFQKQPALQEPWRTWLRRQGSRPGAGPELKALADAIEYQRGPLDGAPKKQ